MSQHDQWFADGAAWLSASQGEPVTHTPRGGAARAVSGALVGHEESQTQLTLDGETERRVREISLPAGAVEPDIEDRVTVGTVEYFVERVLVRSAAFCRLLCVRISAVEVTRPQYRK